MITSPENAAKIQLIASILLVLFATGCGTIREQRATNQLLLSDAVDRAVANIDFSPLAYEKVYLDSRFLQFKNDSAIATNYVISALRQQMIVAGCLLQDSLDSADYVVEARVGTMGSDGHDINYGVPASNTVNTAASIVSGTPPLPALPEVSIARRTHDMAAVKIAAFAYKRDSRMPMWQSGTSIAKSEATGTWVLGAGPFKSGSIHEGTQFAGRETFASRLGRKKSTLVERDFVYRGTRIWDPDLRKKMESGEHKLPQDRLAATQTTNEEENQDGEPAEESPSEGSAQSTAEMAAAAAHQAAAAVQATSRDSLDR